MNTIEEFEWDHSLGLSTQKTIEQYKGCSINIELNNPWDYDDHYFFNQVAYAEDHMQIPVYPYRMLWSSPKEMAFDIILGS